MNALTQFKKAPVLPLLIALALVVGTALTVVPALATPPSGVTTEFIAGTSITGGGISFDEIDVATKTGKGEDKWKVRIDTNGASQLYVVRNTFKPGGHTGWHTHPGPSLISVTSGTITAYDSDDPSCTPHVYTAGTGFVDAGGEHAHLLRNEGSVPAVTVATQLLPPGTARRNEAPSPGNCPF